MNRDKKPKTVDELNCLLFYVPLRVPFRVPNCEQIKNKLLKYKQSIVKKKNIC